MKSDQKERLPIDWQDIRHHLEWAASDRDSLSQEQAQAVLEERARALARVLEEGLQAGERLEVVTFRRGGENYAIEARFLREVLRPVEWTPVPGGPIFLVGVFNLRGEVTALFDLARFAAVAEPESNARVLILGQERPEFGLLADGNQEMALLPRQEILEPPANPAGLGRDCVLGLTADARIVLNGEALLQDRRFVIDRD